MLKSARWASLDGGYGRHIRSHNYIKLNTISHPFANSSRNRWEVLPHCGVHVGWDILCDRVLRPGYYRHVHKRMAYVVVGSLSTSIDTVVSSSVSFTCNFLSISYHFTSYITTFHICEPCF